MLPGLSQMVVGGGASLPELTYITGASSTADSSSYTFSSQSFGDADATRLIIVAVYTAASAGSRFVTGVTIGGVTATQIGSITSNFASSYAQIWLAAVPTGTSGTVALTANNTLQNCRIDIYRAINVGSATPHDVQTKGDSLSSVSVSINIPDGGFLIAVVASIQQPSVSGVTTDSDVLVETISGNPRRAYCGSESAMTAESGRSVSASGSSTLPALIAASWS